MNVNGIGTTGYGVGQAQINTLKNGTQTFNRGLLESNSQKLPSFVGKVYTEEEVYQYVDKKIQQNQSNKKSLADMIKDSCVNWSNAAFKFVGESKTYTYHEFVKEMERRSEQQNK